MAAPAAIKATFSEWRMVKGRKVLQLVMEVPLEHQQHVADALGFPMPDQEIWVAIARLRNEPVEARGGKLAQVAGILCSEGAFNALARETGHQDGKAMIYAVCGVASRRELDSNAEAGGKFRDLKTDYENWLREAA